MLNKKIQFLLILVLAIGWDTFFAAGKTRIFTPDDKRIQYVGRIDFSNPQLPRIWAPGAYIKIRFQGKNCEVYINDQELSGTSHNYIEIVIDDTVVHRMQTTGKTNIIKVAKGLTGGYHNLTICKDTESGIGYMEFAGIKCTELADLPVTSLHKIEFIGNSITCGAGSDLGLIACGQGEWYDQHNAYMSYGPVTARLLHADWMLSSVSGIGLIQSCCNMSITMPQVFDKVNMHDDTIVWDFSRYQPDVVTICLGQNDGISDSLKFCSAYTEFINKIRDYYPKAEIICLSSPMADDTLSTVLKRYIETVVSEIYRDGDTNVRRFFFSKSFRNGCGGHPDLVQHQEMAAELSAYIKKVMHW